MMKTSVFMNIVDYERQRHHWTVRYLCEEYDVEKKDSERSVWMRLCRGADMKKYKEDIEMAIILLVAGICTALILVR